MKKNYEKPEIEAIELEVEDIIQTSGIYLDETIYTEDGGTTQLGGTNAGKISDWLLPTK